MSCNACQRTPCCCIDEPELVVAEPSGSENCESLQTACEDCDIPTDSCCNLTTFQAEAAGKSFVLNIGGRLPVVPPQDFVQPFLVDNPDPAECGVGCCDILEPREIPNLGQKACMPEAVAPGTYQIFARASLFSRVPDADPPTNGGGVINPGAKVSIRYFEDCNNLVLPVEIAGCNKPCCCPGTFSAVVPVPPPVPPPLKAVFPMDIQPYEVLHCVGHTMVYSPMCRPAFQILAVNGCPQDGQLSADLFIANIQIYMLFISSRDLVNCCQDPLASVIPFSDPAGCGQV